MLLVILGRAPSWNTIYNSNSYWKRKVLVDGIHARVINTLLEKKIPKLLFLQKVDIVVTAYFNKRPIDSDNVPAKIYIDPLKNWLMREDNIHYVRKVTTEAVYNPKDIERVEILILDDISIVNVEFTPEFNAAIEAKQVAQQDAERSQYQKIVAQNEADSNRIKQSAITEQILSQKALEKWDGKLPQYWAGGNLPFISIAGK